MIGTVVDEIALSLELGSHCWFPLLYPFALVVVVALWMGKRRGGVRDDGGGAGDHSKLLCFGCAGQVVALNPITWLAERRCIIWCQSQSVKVGTKICRDTVSEVNYH